MANVNMSIRVAGQCIVPNENGELEFETGAGTKTKLQAEDILDKIRQAQSVKEVLEMLQGSGAYIDMEGSRVMVVTTPGGTIILSKDEPSRKIVVDRDVSESTIEQILSVNDYDSIRAVEKILIENRVIEEPEKEMEQVDTSDRNNISLENEADNTDSKDITDGGEIGANRLQRDIRQNPYAGIYSEEQTREMIEQRRKERERSGRNEGMER